MDEKLKYPTSIKYISLLFLFMQDILTMLLFVGLIWFWMLIDTVKLSQPPPRNKHFLLFLLLFLFFFLIFFNAVSYFQSVIFIILRRFTISIIFFTQFLIFIISKCFLRLITLRNMAAVVFRKRNALNYVFNFAILNSRIQS